MTIHEKTKLGIWISGLILMSGCASLNDFCYEQTQQSRARAEYRECGKEDCSRYPRDYKKGWLDGFYEVATGGCSTPPAVAPRCYWDPAQVLDDCDNRRHEYYSGWQDGAVRASQFPDTHYLKIYDTCECPFPRCDCPTDRCCPQAGCVSGNCNGYAADSLGMPYHEGTIESDREIMMMPIPEAISPSTGSPDLPNPVAPSNPNASASEVDPSDADYGELPPVPPEPLDDLPSPMLEGQPRPGNNQAPKPEPVGSASDRDVSYDYGDDNSMTIEFAPVSEPITASGLPAVSNATDSGNANRVPTAVSGTVQVQFGKLSDFDARADKGLIEQRN